MSADRPTASFPPEVKTIHVDGELFVEVVDGHGESVYLTSDEATAVGRKLAALFSTELTAVNNAHTSRWRHMFCDNDPEHVQVFRAGAQGPGGPEAGVRCEGCHRPTSVDDWVLIA